MTTGRRGLLLLAVVAAAVGCGGSSEAGPDSVEVIVYAPASMGDAMANLAAEFEKTTGDDVTLNIAGSNVLAAQIREGGDADVFISADEAIMEDLRQTAAATVAPPVIIASNPIVPAVPIANPAGIEGIDDLTAGTDGRDPIVAICAEAVPCGRAADRVLANAGVSPATVTRESDVRAVVAKLSLGEVDAGFVYRSDLIRSNGELTEIERPAGSEDEINLYPAAIVGEGSPAAQSFIEFLSSEVGQGILAAEGFGPADPEAP